MNAIIKENKALIIETTLRDHLDHIESSSPMRRAE